MTTDRIQAAVDAKLSDQPQPLRVYLRENYDWIVKRLVRWGGLKHDFWSTMAEEFARGGIVGVHGEMTGTILHKAFYRETQRRRLLTPVPMAQPMPRAPVTHDMDQPIPQFPSISGKGRAP